MAVYPSGSRWHQQGGRSGTKIYGLTYIPTQTNRNQRTDKVDKRTNQLVFNQYLHERYQFEKKENLN